MTDEHPSDESAIETTDTTLTVRRTFDAPRERVFRAFTDPEELEAWYAPGDMTARVHALEPEVDGAFSVSMLDGDDSHDVEGTFTEVVENERLVHTWQWANATPGAESLVTVTFRDVDGGAEVVLTHEKLQGRESVEEHARGWAGIVENLGAVL